MCVYMFRFRISREYGNTLHGDYMKIIFPYPLLNPSESSGALVKSPVLEGGKRTGHALVAKAPAKWLSVWY